MSAINEPHPDEQPAASEAEAFFGGQESPDPATFNPESGQFDAPGLPDLTPEQAAAEAAAYRERTGEPAPEPAATEPELASAEAAATPPPAQENRKSGQLAREYIVFQKVPLVERTLKHLLAQIEGGKPAARIAYIELHRATTRTDRAAIGEAHAAHRDALGEECDLAAVSARSFKERHVAPETVPAERRIRIT